MPKKIAHLFKDYHLPLAFSVLGLLTFLTQSSSSSSQSRETTGEESSFDIQSADTYIPKGYVLVPIEIANSESLNGLVGNTGGVVDLYLAKGPQQKSNVKVGIKLKILRAPLNPQQYAVLLPENDSSKLLSYPGPFIAVVQNPKERGTALTPQKRRSIQIEYQN